MPEKALRKIGVLVIVLILLVVILKLSFYLRSIGYDHVPETFVILDERTNVWHGLSIRNTGVPAAWSNLEIYMRGFGAAIKGFNVEVDNKSVNLLNFINYPKPAVAIAEYDFGRGLRHTRFVQPYLDHPPFGALVLSTFVPDNVKSFSDLTPTDFRKMSLWLGIATGALIFFLGWQISNNPLIGFLAAAIYGSVPTFILLSRYALLENVLNPLMLLSLNLLLFSQKINPSYFRAILILAGIASGLSALTKIIGWFVLFLGLILLKYWKVSLKDSLFFIIPSSVIGLLYVAWGLYLAPNLFIDIFHYQGLERGFIGSINFLVSATRIGILNFPFDGWWIGGFLCLGIILTKKDYLPISISAVISLLTAILLGGANYPWYFIPLIPFMCLSTAYFIWQVITKPIFINILIFFLVFFSSSFYWGYGVYRAALESTNYQQPFGLYRLFLIFFLIAGFVIPAMVKYKIFRYLWFTLTLIILIQLFRWNTQSLYYILSHWGKLPSLYTPGTF